MKHIIVASENPVKIKAALNGFERMFPNVEFSITGMPVMSGVNEQPIGNSETYRGACNRLEAIQSTSPHADYWIGLEGGVEITNDEIAATAWIVIRSRDGQYGKGKAGMFILPPVVSKYVHEGKELGTATDIVFSKTNSKQKGGTIAELTDGLITRTSYYEEAVICALIPFKNPKLYPIA
jgi:inosine/xanthosine triphosphatase